jgi:calcium-dependent protein kinase
VAPEILMNKKYDHTCDIWSLGVIMFILLSGFPPFYGETKNDIYHKIENCIYSLTTSDWTRVTTQAKDLIRRMLEKNPKKRITIEKAL